MIHHRTPTRAGPQGRSGTDANQIARRNLTPDAFRLALGRRYNRMKGKQGGDHKSKVQSDTLIDMAARLASEHGTSEDYCKERWGFARNYANKMIAAAEVVGNLGTNVPTPTNEAQARPLTRLDPEEQPEAWQEANQRAEAEGQSRLRR